MKQWFISHIFIFCMFSHRILFYKSPFQWDWVHSSCSELPAQETGYPNMVGTFMLSFVFPPDIFKHFFKSKVGVFLVKRAQLKKKKKDEDFFSILIDWTKTIKFLFRHIHNAHSCSSLQESMKWGHTITPRRAIERKKVILGNTLWIMLNTFI